MSDPEQLGKLAQDVLDNEAFNEAFKKLEERLAREWINSPDLETRERAWGMTRLLEKVRWELEYFMTEGNLEQVIRKEQEETEEDERAKQKRKDEYFNTPLKGTRLKPVPPQPAEGVTL